MANDDAPGKVIPFGKRWRFPADLQRFRQMLDDDEVAFEESDVDDGLACAEAAIAKSVPGAHEVLVALLDVRAYRTSQAGDADAALAKWAAIIDRYPNHREAYVGRSDVFEKRGDHDAAMAELDRYVTLSPTDALGYLHRGKLYKAWGDGERALANFLRVTQLDDTVSEAHLAIAGLLEEKGDTRGAARAYAKLAEEDLEDAEGYAMRGFMYFVSGQEDLALADYETAVALDPNDADAVSWRALLRGRQGREDLALADYTRLISMRPHEARGYRRRGEILARTGKPAEALRDLDRAIALGGDNPGAAHCARGTALAALGDVEAALAAYGAAIEKDPTNVDARLGRFQIHAERERWDKCQIDAEAMLARSPDDTSLLLAHARVLQHEHRRDDALGAYDRLIALEPKNAVAYKERSELQAGRGENLAAHADMARAFALAPEDPEIRASHGRDLAQTAKTPEEREAGWALIASSAELDAENPETWARAALCFSYSMNPKEAFRCIDRAVELAPDEPGYLDARATYRTSAAPSRSDDPEGYEESVRTALADVERAIELCEDEDDALSLLSDRSELRADLGDLEGAIADQTRIIEASPQGIDAWADRARLRKRAGDMAGALSDAAKVRELEDETLAELMTFHPEVTNMQRFDLEREH